MRGHCHERGEKKANKYPEEKEIDIIWDILRKKGLMFLQTVKLPSFRERLEFFDRSVLR